MIQNKLRRKVAIDSMLDLLNILITEIIGFIHII